MIIVGGQPVDPSLKSDELVWAVLRLVDACGVNHEFESSTRGQPWEDNLASTSGRNTAETSGNSTANGRSSSSWAGSSTEDVARCMVNNGPESSSHDVLVGSATSHNLHPPLHMNQHQEQQLQQRRQQQQQQQQLGPQTGPPHQPPHPHNLLLDESMHKAASDSVPQRLNSDQNQLQRCVFVTQGEYAIVDPSKVQVVGTDEMTTCVGIGMWHPITKRAAAGHVDSTNSAHMGVRQMLSALLASTPLARHQHNHSHTMQQQQQQQQLEEEEGQDRSQMQKQEQQLQQHQSQQLKSFYRREGEHQKQSQQDAAIHVHLVGAFRDVPGMQKLRRPSCRCHDRERATLPMPALPTPQPAPSHPQPAPSHPQPAPSHPQPAPSHPQPAPSHPQPAPSHPQPAPLPSLPGPPKPPQPSTSYTRSGCPDDHYHQPPGHRDDEDGHCCRHGLGRCGRDHGCEDHGDDVGVGKHDLQESESWPTLMAALHALHSSPTPFDLRTAFVWGQNTLWKEVGGTPGDHGDDEVKADSEDDDDSDDWDDEDNVVNGASHVGGRGRNDSHEECCWVMVRPQPKTRGMAMETHTGRCFMATFPMHLQEPDPVLRYSVLRELGQPGLTTFYRSSEDVFVLPPVSFAMHAHFWRNALRLSDREILQKFSTSPYAESDRFVAFVRRCFELRAHQTSASLFPKRAPRRYCRDSEGRWVFSSA